MEELAKMLQTLMDSFGFWGVVEILLILALSQLIKWPLKKIAADYAAKKGKEKVSYTAWLYFLPVLLSLLLTFVLYGWRYLAWDLNAFNWQTYLSLAASIAGASEGVYAGIEIFVKKYLSDKTAKEEDYQTAEATVTVDGQTVTATGKGRTLEKAQAEAEKNATKLAKAQAKVAKTAEAAALAKAEKIAALQEELANLNK